MARTPRDVTEYELAILQVLWDSGPATIRQLTDVVYPTGGTAQYATVQKLLERLERKGCVRRDRSGSAHVFTAALGRARHWLWAVELVAGLVLVVFGVLLLTDNVSWLSSQLSNLLNDLGLSRLSKS